MRPNSHSNALDLAPGVSIPLQYANRHGLITGETGTGKSVTLLRMVERFSAAGVPSFLADVKGDLGRIGATCPVTRLDAYAETGAPFRASPADLGPDLLARSLDLTDAQAGTVELLFHVAGSRGWRLDTVADVQAGLGAMMSDRENISVGVGQVSAASVGVVQRSLLRVSGDVLSAPSFDVARLLEPGVSLLDATRLMRSPRLYAALLMHTLSELDRRLPEVGDMDRPRLAFFFDEAHLLFRDVPSALLMSIERTVRLIRSKGVGVYFASQRPDDVPSDIREQLAHRVAHSRRLGIGRADVATMGPDGRPVTRAGVTIAAPGCLTAPARPAVVPVAAPAVIAPAAAPVLIPAPTGPRPHRAELPETDGLALDDCPTWLALAAGFVALGMMVAGLASVLGFSGRVAFVMFVAVSVCSIVSAGRGARMRDVARRRRS